MTREAALSLLFAACGALLTLLVLPELSQEPEAEAAEDSGVSIDVGASHSGDRFAKLLRGLGFRMTGYVS